MASTSQYLNSTNILIAPGVASRFIRNVIEGKSRYSTNSSGDDPQPCKFYGNADLYKLQIINENIEKAGVYRWVNLINGSTYVGSSVNLGRRLRDYFNISFL